MKLVRLTFLFVLSLVISWPALAGLESEINEIKNSVAKIQKTFISKEKLKIDIQDLGYLPFGTAAVTKLQMLSKQFDALITNQNYESEWESYLQKESIYKWPCQAAKQAVGGSLFYPKDVVEWVEDAVYMDHLLQRKDILWSFALASKYEDPRGKLYLASTLYEIWSNSHFNAAPDFYADLHKQVSNKLVLAADNLESVYTLGLGHSFRSFFPFNLEQAENYFNKILISQSGTENRFKAKAEMQLLRMKATYRKAYETIEAPKIEDFRKIAKTYNYGRVLLMASSFTEDEKEQEALLSEAIETYQYIPAYIKRGKLRSSKTQELAQQDFVAAGE